MNSWLLLCCFLHCASSISVGLISNVNFVPQTSGSIKTINDTLQDCLCTMMASSNISALNYFSNNTCQLFANESLIDASFSWTVDTNSRFYFLQLPVKAQVSTQSTTVPTVLTTETIPRVTTVAGNSNGTSGNGNQSLNGPVDVALSPNGTLYVADWVNNRVQAFPPNSPVATTVISSITHPQGLFIDNRSNLYVTSSGSAGAMFYPLSRPTYNWSMSMGDAYGVTADSSGNVYVSGAGSNLIRQGNINNALSVSIANSSSVNGCRHMYLDEKNSILYVADTANHRIAKLFLGQNMTVQNIAGSKGSQGSAANKLRSPAGVYVSRIDGAVYVADTGNHRIQKWPVNASAGITVAGNSAGTAGSDMNSLNAPYAVILDPTETYLYAADYYNNRVQRIRLP